MTVRSVVGFQWGHKEAQGACSGSPLAWRPATSHVGSLYGAAHITEQHSWTLGQKTYLRRGGGGIDARCYLCNWHSTFIYIKGLNPVIGLHCRQTCMPFWSELSLLSPHSAFSILSNQHISAQWQRMRSNAHQKQGCVCTMSQCARVLTHGDPPLVETVCFSILAHCSLPDSITLFLLIIRPLCFDKSLPSTSFVASPCGLKPHRHSLCSSTCRPFVFHRSSEQMWLLCGSAFVRCQSQHPEAMFSSWSPFLWPSLVCFFCSLAFGTLYPAYSSYKAVKTKNVKEYVSITPGY